MAGIFHPTRGGTRGGQDQFNWEDVKTDKDREYYLGHSVKASVGKWQEGKDLIWYTRDRNKEGEVEKRKKEIESVKDVEARAMAAALGHKSHSSAATSLTAKELQEVLSRAQPPTDDVRTNRGEASQLKKQMEAAQIKDGADGKLKRSKKKKKEKRKKKKKKKNKKKEKDGSDDSSSDEEVENSNIVSSTAHSSKHRPQTFTTRHKRPDNNNALLRRNKRKSSESDTSAHDGVGRRESNNTRTKYERRDNERGRYGEQNKRKSSESDTSAHDGGGRRESNNTRTKYERRDNERGRYDEQNKRKSSESDASGHDGVGRRESNNTRTKHERRDTERGRYDEQNKRKSSESDTSAHDGGGRRESNNTRTKHERRDHERYTGKKRKTPVAPKHRRHCDSEDDTSESDGDKVHRNKHKPVKLSRYSSENESSGSSDKPVSRRNDSTKNDRINKQPADSHVEFTPRSKRPRQDIESS